ncbi:MAG: methyltransferase [Pseudomonadota bacterium]
MSDASLTPQIAVPSRGSRLPFHLRLALSPAFQSWASRVPFLRRIARAEGAAMFDLLSGFLQSQVLHALVELEILDMLSEGDLGASDLGRKCGIPEHRMIVLLRAGVALGLLRTRRGAFRLSHRGAALLGVPGLSAMIRHHSVLYGDLADPAAFFRGRTDPELARFWPYVLGPGSARDTAAAERYSELMAESQALVAEETLRTVSFSGIRHLMDVGGGSGAFLAAVANTHADLRATLLDLPDVVPAATRRFHAEGCAERVSVVPGSFREGALPTGADAISLVRVLYDHRDETVAGLLARCYAALPRGGRLIISEPMTGGARPNRPGDVYFALYTMAMGTGRTRGSAEIAALVAQAGFGEVREHRTFRPYITGVVTAVRLT